MVNKVSFNQPTFAGLYQSPAEGLYHKGVSQNSANMNAKVIDSDLDIDPRDHILKDLYLPKTEHNKEKGHKILDKIEDIYKNLDSYTQLIALCNKSKDKSLTVSNEDFKKIIDYLNINEKIIDFTKDKQGNYVLKNPAVNILKDVLNKKSEQLPIKAQNLSQKFSHLQNQDLEVTKAVMKIMELVNNLIEHINRRMGS